MTHSSWYYVYSGPGGARTNSYQEALRLSSEQPHQPAPAPTSAKQRSSSVGTSVPQQPRARPKPRLVAETQHGAAAASSAASSSECRQFWQAGNYSSAGASRASSSALDARAGAGDGLDRARTHPKFLHSNATSHKWAIGAIAELIDNSYDEMETLGVRVPAIEPRTQNPVRFAASPQRLRSHAPTGCRADQDRCQRDG